MFINAYNIVKPKMLTFMLESTQNVGKNYKVAQQFPKLFPIKKFNEDFSQSAINKSFVQP